MILATDIAEASVTIPDATLVIDGGLHRLVALAPALALALALGLTLTRTPSRRSG